MVQRIWGNRLENVLSVVNPYFPDGIPKQQKEQAYAHSTKLGILSKPDLVKFRYLTRQRIGSI
jgi:hypothetical protein